MADIRKEIANRLKLKMVAGMINIITTMTKALHNWKDEVAKMTDDSERIQENSGQTMEIKDALKIIQEQLIANDILTTSLMMVVCSGTDGGTELIRNALTGFIENIDDTPLTEGIKRELKRYLMRLNGLPVNKKPDFKVLLGGAETKKSSDNE